MNTLVGFIIIMHWLTHWRTSPGVPPLITWHMRSCCPALVFSSWRTTIFLWWSVWARSLGAETEKRESSSTVTQTVQVPVQSSLVQQNHAGTAWCSSCTQLMPQAEQERGNIFYSISYHHSPSQRHVRSWNKLKYTMSRCSVRLFCTLYLQLHHNIWLHFTFF